MKVMGMGTCQYRFLFYRPPSRQRTGSDDFGLQGSKSRPMDYERLFNLYARSEIMATCGCFFHGFVITSTISDNNRLSSCVDCRHVLTETNCGVCDDYIFCASRTTHSFNKTFQLRSYLPNTSHGFRRPCSSLHSYQGWRKSAQA